MADYGCFKVPVMEYCERMPPNFHGSYLIDYGEFLISLTWVKDPIPQDHSHESFLLCTLLSILSPLMCSTFSFFYPFSPSSPLLFQENVPPRPPLPKSYYLLEPSPNFPPSIPPLPFDSTAWLRNLAIDDGYLDDEDTLRKVFGCLCPCLAFQSLSPNCCPMSSLKTLF